MKRNKLLIHNDHILHNLSIIKKYAPASKILPMVKANAFGHGLLNVATLLTNHVEALAVARYDEAIEVIKAKLPLSVVLMSGEIDIERIKILIQLGCQIVIATKHQYQQLINVDIDGQTTVWLKVNTGMNRLGLSIIEAEEVIVRLKNCNWVKNIILMTHLSDADVPNSAKTKLQIKLLKNVARNHDLPTSISNSAAIIQYPESHGDWIRPGIMLYGASPSASFEAAGLGLKATMTLSSFLMDTREQHEGDQIGYGSTWVCKKDMLLGIIPLGYGDGYPRNIAPGTPVFINGVLCPTVGRVSMDLITVDISHCKSAKIGDQVELWGNNLPIDRIAKCANTIPNELLTHISPRLIPVTILSEAIYETPVCT